MRRRVVAPFALEVAHSRIRDPEAMQPRGPPVRPLAIGPGPPVRPLAIVPGVYRDMPNDLPRAARPAVDSQIRVVSVRQGVAADGTAATFIDGSYCVYQLDGDGVVIHFMWMQLSLQVVGAHGYFNQVR